MLQFLRIDPRCCFPASWRLLIDPRAPSFTVYSDPTVIKSTSGFRELRVNSPIIRVPIYVCIRMSVRGRLWILILHLVAYRLVKKKNMAETRRVLRDCLKRAFAVQELACPSGSEQ